MVWISSFGVLGNKGAKPMKHSHILKRVVGLVLGIAFVFAGADVITISSGTPGAAGNTVNDFVNYIYAQLLEVAEYNTVLRQFGQKTPVPEHGGKTIQFVREERLPFNSNPAQLTEGVTPDAEGITVSEFTATLSQYGRLVKISDIAELTARHNLVAQTVRNLGLDAADLYDALIYNVLSAGTSTYLPNGRSGITNLVATDTVSYNDLVELDALLRGGGAKPFEIGDYAMVIPPQVKASLVKDTVFLQAAQFKAPEKIWRGEIGQFAGHRVVETNSQVFAPQTQAISGKTTTVYTSFAIALNAYQISDWQNLRVFVTPPGGGSDALYQSWKIGYKFAAKSVITNNSWLYVMFSAGNNSVNHA